MIDVQQENVMAIMCSLQRLSERYSDDARESAFISNSIRTLTRTTWSGDQVTIEKWTITPFEVDVGPGLGRGDL
jgi:hypothetical protein